MFILKPKLDEKKIGEEIEKTPEALINVVSVRSSKLIFELATMMFKKLGIAGYPDRDGILLLINLTTMEFALLFDHRLCLRLSNDLLKGIRDQLVSDFKQGNYTEGICRLIQSCRGRSKNG